MGYPGSGCTVIFATQEQLRELIERAVQKAVADAFETQTAGFEMRRSWLSNREAMAEFGFSRSTLARWRRSGRLRYSKQGSLVLYKRTDFEILLDAGLRRGTNQ